MFRSVRDRGATVRSRVQHDRPIFSNPSGRRWKFIRAVLLLVLVAALAFVAIVVPRITTSPALGGRPTPEGPSLAEVGTAPPVIGDGPLTRIVRLVPSAATTYAQDPFDGQVVAELTTREVGQAEGAEYVIQRYGYGAGVTKTISLTFDDGPDPFWTPKLLDLLSKYQVPATFFVTGEQMAKNPEIMKRLVADFDRDWPGVPRSREILTLAQEYEP